MQGTLNKMATSLGDVARYKLPVGDSEMDLNPLIGKELTIRYLGGIYCTECGRKTKKSFSQGHCFPCVRKLASCDMCILKPELCHFDQGTCRQPEWGKMWCMDTHFVYVSNTSALKVGITRHSNIPSRWIDQGASQALPVFKVASRHISGLLEVEIGKNVQDKTNWRAMLKGEPEPMDLLSHAEGFAQNVSDTVVQLQSDLGPDSVTRMHDAQVTSIAYPVIEYPKKLSTHNLDKTPQVSGVLQGIKAQYLILDTGVINIRKYTGYDVEITVK